MNHCERLKQKIFDYIDSELEPSERRFIEKHLSECAMCKKFYSSLKSLKANLKNLKPVHAPDSFQVVLQERLRREIARKRGFGYTQSPVRRWQFLWIPATIAVILLVALFNPFIPAFRSRTVPERQNWTAAEVDQNHVNYVIDEIEASKPVLSGTENRVHSPIDSLLSEESPSPVLEMYQPVRF
jgi:anti-sigma factor RsiW